MTGRLAGGGATGAQEERPGIEAWIVSDGTVGREVQGTGLAAALGAEARVLRVRPSRLLRAAPRAALAPFVALAREGGEALAPPWPDVAITCGRRLAGASIGLRRRSGGRVLTVHIQDPRVPPRHFDFLVTPQHDPARGGNVIRTLGSLNGLTAERLKAEAAETAPRVARLPRPLVAVSVGGSNRRYALPVQRMAAFGAELAEFAGREGCGLMVATSRRTGAAQAAALSAALAGTPSVVWTGDGANPYVGFLGLADYIVVSADSVNMVCEACRTGRPVLVAALEEERGRLAVFHREMERRGLTRRFRGRLERWSYEPLDEAGAVAARVRDALDRRREAPAA